LGIYLMWQRHRCMGKNNGSRVLKLSPYHNYFIWTGFKF
jgi:hypothetical protein